MASSGLSRVGASKRFRIIWNVLRGEMCFVGPRAERTEFANVLSEAIPFYRQRYAVKPGLTGWAQINTPRDQPEETFRRLEYDLYYLKHFSRGLDAYILLHTVREVLMPGSACGADHRFLWSAVLPVVLSAWHTIS